MHREVVKVVVLKLIGFFHTTSAGKPSCLKLNKPSFPPNPDFFSASDWMQKGLGQARLSIEGGTGHLARLSSFLSAHTWAQTILYLQLRVFCD